MKDITDAQFILLIVLLLMFLFNFYLIVYVWGRNSKTDERIRKSRDEIDRRLHHIDQVLINVDIMLKAHEEIIEKSSFLRCMGYSIRGKGSFSENSDDWVKADEDKNKDG